MDDVCRVFLIGESLLIDVLAQLLAEESWLEVEETALSPQVAIAAVPQARPHLFIVAHAGNRPPHSPDPILDHYPGIPIIHVDLNRDYVQIITSRRVGARRTDLLAAIKELSGASSEE
ncbi:MAG: hypothetical protein ACOC9X_05300 [bacterium]